VRTCVVVTHARMRTRTRKEERPERKREGACVLCVLRECACANKFSGVHVCTRICIYANLRAYVRTLAFGVGAVCVCVVCVCL